MRYDNIPEPASITAHQIDVLFCCLFQLDTTIDICSCLSTFSNLLKLRETPTLQDLVNAMTTVSNPVGNSNGITKRSAEDDDGERELQDSSLDSQLRSSMLLLDNIHIRLTKVL